MAEAQGTVQAWPSPALARAEARSHLEAGLVLLFLVAAVVGDLQAGERLLGSAARSPAAFLVLPILALVLFGSPSSPRNLLAQWRQWPPFAVALAFVCVTAFLVGAVRTLTGPAFALGQSPIVKAMTQAITYALWLGYVLLGVTAVRRFRLITRDGLLLVLAALLALVLLEVALAPSWLVEQGALHSRLNFQHRPRGLFSESSLLGATAAMAGAVALRLEERPRRQAAIFAVTTAIVLLSESRGATITWALAIVAAFAPSLWRRRRQAVVLVPVMLAALLLAPTLLSRVDLATDPSFETRASYEFTTVEVLVQRPLGMGFGSYLYDAQDFLLLARQHLDAFFQRGINAELSARATQGDDTNLYPKTIVSVLVWPAGFVGLVAAVVLAKSLAEGAWFGDLPLRLLALVALGVYFTFASGFDQPLLGFLLGFASGELDLQKRRELGQEPPA